MSLPPHTQTHSHSDSLARSQSQSAFPALRLSHTHTDSYSNRFIGRVIPTQPFSYSASIIFRADAHTHTHSDSRTVGLTQTRSYKDSPALRLTRWHPITITLPLTQTQSYPDSLVPTHTPTDTYVELFPFQTDPGSASIILRFTRYPVHSQSDLLTLRCAHTQTHSHSDSFARPPSRTDSLSLRLTLTLKLNRCSCGVLPSE